MFTLATNYVDSPLDVVSNNSGDLNVSLLTYFPQAVVLFQHLHFKITDPERYSQFSGKRFHSQLLQRCLFVPVQEAASVEVV